VNKIVHSLLTSAVCATLNQTHNIYLKANPTKQAVAVPWPFAAKYNSFVAASGIKNPRRLFLMVLYVATLCASGLASFSEAPASLECSVLDSLAD